MAENTKEFDWFASWVKNPDLTINDFKKLGITPDTAEFKSKEDYENLPQVKEAFRLENGEFDKETFDKFYDNALLLYNNYAVEEYAPKATEMFGYLDSQWDRPEGSKIMDTTPRFQLLDKASDQSLGIDFVNRYGPGPFAKQSAREIGQQQKVVDFETGETLDWTPDDKTGLIDALFRPTLVLASYDKDELDDKGNLIHKRGDLKYNEDGLPYYETLGNRSISGKQVLTYSDSLTREGSWLNKYDFFDSDGLDKSMVGTLAKTAFEVMPYLIPGVGEVFGALTAITALNRVLPVLGKAIAGMANGRGEDKFTEQMNKWEGAFSRFDPSVSDHSQEHLVSFENLGNLISSISGQLFQQRVVGSIPMLLNKYGDVAKQAEWGRALSYGYMSLTSAQDSFNTFKEAGASDMVAGWAFVANAVALGSLMATDYGKGLLFKGSWLDENVLKAPAKKAADEVRAQLTSGIENAGPKEKAKFIQGLINIYNKHFSSAAADTFLNRGISEAMEEVMEESIIDVQKAITNVAQAIGVNVGDQKLDFGLSWNDVLQRYGMAAAGGFLGGGIFHLQGKWDKFLANDMVQHTDEDTLQKLTYYIAQGRGGEIRDFYRQWHKKGLLGSTSLGTNLTTISSINGTETVSEPAGNNLSQNDVVFNTMMEYVNTIESTISKEGLKKDVGSLVRNALNGYRESERSLRGDTLINLGVHDLLIKDVYDVASKIVAKNAEIQAEINNLTVKNDSPDAKKETEENIRNSEKLKQLEQELNDLRLQRDTILNGENNWKYVGQAIFASNTELAKNFLDLSIERYSQVVLGRKYNTLTDEEKESLQKQHEEYMKDEGKNKILRAFDLYLGLSQRYADRLKQEDEILKGHTLNETRRVGTRFQEEYFKTLGEYQKVSNEYGLLKAKEDKTEEDNVKLEELKNKVEGLKLALEQTSENPYALLIHPSEDNVEIVNLLSQGLLTSDQTGQAYALVKQMYQKYASGEEQLNNDIEYESLLRNTVADFLRGADISRRVDNWLDNIATRESDDGNGGMDLGLLTNWLQDNGLEELYDFDTDALNFDAPLLNDIKRLANTFIQNVGINNKVATDALNELRSFMEERGFSSEDINQLINDVTPQYVENGQILPITNFIEEIDELRKNINYSSFIDLLQDFTTDLLGERSSIIDLIQNEKRKLANSPNLADYFIRNPEVINELKEETIELIKVVRGVLQGTIDKTNSSINSSKHGEEYLPLAELSENTARILNRQSYDLENEILTLINISKLNGQRTLKVHEEIDKHMRGKFIYTLVNNPALVQKFGEHFYNVDASGNKTPVDIAQISKDLLQGRIDLSKTETADPGDLLRFEVAFETELYKAVNNSAIGKDTNKIAAALVDLFPDAWKLDTTIISDTTETITPNSLLSYLQTIVSVPAEAFYTQYEPVTQAEDSKFAPIYSQEMALRNVTALIANAELSNAILEELKKRIDTSKIDKNDKVSIKWLSNLQTLPNMVIVPGGAGCGKTTAIATNTSKMFADYDHEYFCLAPEMEQAENLANAVGEGIRHTDKATFFKNIFKVDLQHYRKNETTEHFELAEIPVINNNLFDKSKKLKILFIDEVSLFTESELKLISDYAVKNGIHVIGLGDPVQNSAKVYTDEYLTEAGETKHSSEKEWSSTGLEDCLYFGSSYLTASLRPSNLAKFENFNTLNNALNKIMEKWKQEPWLSFGALDSFVPNEVELKYFENPDLFYGDKLVEDTEDLVEIAKKYLPRGKVTIITDDLGKYQTVPDDIQVKAYNKMQGMETDFVLVDVDFAKNNNFGSGGGGKYAALRDIYTIAQRSRVGTVIKKDGLNGLLPGLTQKNSPEVGQRMIMDQNDIAVFKEKRGRILATLNKGLNLFDYIKELKPIVTSTPAVNPVQNTPPPPTPPAPPTPTSPNSTTPPVVSPTVPPTTPLTPQPTNNGNGGNSGNGTNPPGSNPDGNPPAPAPNPALPPVPPGPNPVSYQQSAQSFTEKGKTAMYDSQFKTFVFGTNFEQVEKSSEHSLINWMSRNGGDKIAIKSSSYKKLIWAIGSGIKTKLPVDFDSILLEGITNYPNNKDIDTSTFTSDLKRMLLLTPEIYVQEYNKDFKIITAIFRDGEDYIQIPIGLTKTALTGIYTKGFKRLKNIAKKEGNEKWRPLEAFQQEHPEIIITPEWGVAAIEYNPKEQNLGKVSIAMTDQAGYVPYLYDWYKPDGSWWISHYKDLCHMCIQKPVNPQTVLKFITSLKYNNTTDQKTIELLQQRGLWEDPTKIVEYLTGNDLINLPASGKEHYRVLEGRAWQALPAERALTFMKVGLEAAYKTPAFEHMLTNMTAFMHFLSKPNNKIKDEIHAMILSDGEQSFIVRQEIQNGHMIGYRIMPYADGSYTESNDDRIINIQKRVPFANMCQQLFGKPTAKVEFVRLLNYADSDSYSMWNLTPNDNIFILFGTQAYDWNTLSDRMMEKDEFVNGVYVNDSAGDLLDPNSAFRKFTGNKKGYWIKGDIWNTIWGIDESGIQAVANPTQQPQENTTVKLFTEEFNKIKEVIPDAYKAAWDKKLARALERINAGENLDTVMGSLIEGINNNMAFTYNDWTGKRVVKNGDKYRIENYNNFDLWLSRRVVSLAKAGGMTVPDGSTAVAEINNLDNKNFAIIAITAPDGSVSHGALVRYNSGRLEYNPMTETDSVNTYQAYMQLQESINQLQDVLKPIRHYLDTLIWKYTTSKAVDPVAVSQWLLQNKDSLGNFTEVLNNYLEQRILANEC